MAPRKKNTPAVKVEHSESELLDMVEYAEIQLPDGTVLDQRQAAACVMRAETNMTTEQIADLCGYADRTQVSRFLRSKNGMLGVRIALQSLITAAGIQSIQTLRALLSAKREDVRRQAAKDLVDLAGFNRAVPTEQGKGGRAININISMGEQGHANGQGVIVEGELIDNDQAGDFSHGTGMEGGGGKNCDP